MLQMPMNTKTLCNTASHVLYQGVWSKILQITRANYSSRILVCIR